MTLEELDVYLRENTENEQWHLDNPGQKSLRYQKIGQVEKNHRKIYLFDFEEDVLNEGFTMFKESRYTELYAHCHKYLEVNYIYSGQCSYTINGMGMTLNEGDVCILEEGAVHSAKYKGQNDIVINIVLKDDFYGADFLRQINNKEILSRFFMNCRNQSIEHNHFLVFRNQGNELFNLTMKSMMCLYFSHKFPGFYSMLNEYIRMMYLHLSVMPWDDVDSGYMQSEDEKCIEIIQYIQNHYNECSLRDIARVFNYNYNYAGNMLKRKTGHTFSELKLEQQLLAAKEEIYYTKLPISEICCRCGLSNRSFFSKKFKEYFGCYPREFRKHL